MAYHSHCLLITYKCDNFKALRDSWMMCLLSWIIPRPRLDIRSGEGIFPCLLVPSSFTPLWMDGWKVSYCPFLLGRWEREAVGGMGKKEYTSLFLPRLHSLPSNSTNTLIPFKVMILHACKTNTALIYYWPAVSVLT